MINCFSDEVGLRTRVFKRMWANRRLAETIDLQSYGCSVMGSVTTYLTLMTGVTLGNNGRFGAF
jgi:hypothetical protein